MKGYDEIFAAIFTSILAGISIVFKGKIKSILTKKVKKNLNLCFATICLSQRKT